VTGIVGKTCIIIITEVYEIMEPIWLSRCENHSHRLRSINHSDNPYKNIQKAPKILENTPFWHFIWEIVNFNVKSPATTVALLLWPVSPCSVEWYPNKKRILVYILQSGIYLVYICPLEITYPIKTNFFQAVSSFWINQVKDEKKT
jgi:hypothetical protein